MFVQIMVVPHLQGVGEAQSSSGRKL